MFIPAVLSKTKRKIGLFQLVFIGVGGTIGSGIFVLLGPGVELAGEALPWAFLLAGLLSLGVALIYAEFASAMPTSGSSVNLLFQAYKSASIPFIVAWLIILGDISAAAINALGFSYYTSLLVPLDPTIIAVGIVTLLVMVNVRGVGKATWIETITSGILVAGLAVFVSSGLSQAGVSFAAFEGLSWGLVFPVIGATALIYTAFIGYEDIVSVAGEVKKPKKNIPRALIITVILITVLFYVISVVAIDAVPLSELGDSETPFFLVAEKIGGIGKFIILPLAMLATLSTLITTLLVGSRELYGISKEGFFKSYLGKLNKWKVPTTALFIVGGVTLLLILTNSVEFVAYLGNTVYLITLPLVAIGVIRMRRKRPYIERPFRMPFFPVLPLVVSIVSILILLFVGVTALLVTALWTILGFILYMLSYLDKDRAKWVAVGMLILITVCALGYIAIQMFQ